MVVSLSPIIPDITINKKSSLIGDDDSLKNSIPIITVPIAPIAVQHAYAVPRGIPLIAYSSNIILIIMNIIVSIDGVIFVNPSEYFIIVAHITSHIPAIIRYIHGFILIIPKKKNKSLIWGEILL